jgi:hypothetical protein
MMIRVLVLLGMALSATVFAGETHYAELETTSGKTLNYAVHLPDGFAAANTYPVLIGPGDAVEGSDTGFYWQSDPYSHGWIIVDAQLWEIGDAAILGRKADLIIASH